MTLPELLRQYQTETKDEHVQWMCSQMMSVPMGPDKLNRWLGFIQGTLWRDGLRTIDQMREEVRQLKEVVDKSERP